MVTKYLLNMAIYVLYIEAIELMNMIISLHDFFYGKHCISTISYFSHISVNLKSPAKTMAIFPKKKN